MSVKNYIVGVVIVLIFSTKGFAQNTDTISNSQTDFKIENASNNIKFEILVITNIEIKNSEFEVEENTSEMNDEDFFTSLLKEDQITFYKRMMYTKINDPAFKNWNITRMA